MEDEVLANAGVDVFEEVFKLIFTKLYDEFLSRKDKDIINYFAKQVTQTAVGEPVTPYGNKPSYLDGSDYDALKAVVSNIADEGFRVRSPSQRPQRPLSNKPLKISRSLRMDLQTPSRYSLCIVPGLGWTFQGRQRQGRHTQAAFIL